MTHYKRLFIIALFSILSADVTNYYNNLISSENASGVTQAGHSYYLHHPNNSKIVLLIHGYTSNPSETINLGRYLYNQGFDVFGVRMEGHGTSPEDLRNTPWETWYRSVNSAYNALQTQYSNIYVFGVSMGALAALKLAEEYSPNSVVCAGTFLYPTNKLVSIGHVLYPVIKLFRIKLGYIDVPIPPSRQHITYIKNPLSASMELMDFSKNVRRKLKNVTMPVLLMQCPDDDVADVKSSKYIYRHIKSERKEIRWVGKEHSFLIDRDEELYQQIGDWYRDNT